MKTLTSVIGAFLLIILLTQCENNKNLKIDYIRYGTSFNNCVGYCTGNITISDSRIELRLKSLNPDIELPDIDSMAVINSNYWNRLTEKVNTKSFWDIPSVTGCPDCADGGAEWIEIGSDDNVHRVNFEYGNEPDAVKNFIGYLRTYKASCNFRPLKNFNERTIIDQQGVMKKVPCTNDCDQYLVKLIENKDTSFYFDPHINSIFKSEGLTVHFHAVLLNDSTTVQKPGTSALIKVRNIYMNDIRVKIMHD